MWSIWCDALMFYGLGIPEAEHNNIRALACVLDVGLWAWQTILPLGLPILPGSRGVS